MVITSLLLTLVRSHLEHQFDHTYTHSIKKPLHIRVYVGEGLQDDWEDHGPENRRLQGSLIVVFYLLIGKYKEGKDCLKVPGESTCYRDSNFGHWNNQTYSKLSWAHSCATWSHFWSQPCLEQDPRQYSLEFTFNQIPPMFLWFCV